MAGALAQWAARFEATPEDERLAHAALVDTVAVAVAGASRVAEPVARALREPGRWAAWAHVLDFDDLHLPSTTHISAVCVPVMLACGGTARDYLVAAGVMARLGTALGWPHYSRGWHATTTSGAVAAAAGAAAAGGLADEGIARAMALAVPASGGVQRAFGTDAKALQVAFAVEAGMRAATLAAAGAGADATALDQWFELVGGDPARLEVTGPAVPGGLAVKRYPCCYALQRPIAAAQRLREATAGARIERVQVRTPASSVQPLVHRIPGTGLRAKFSLHHGVAAALLEESVGFDSFSDAAARRPALRALAERVEVELTPGGDGLLSGRVELRVRAGGRTHEAVLDVPPGAPGRALSDAEMAGKLAVCGLAPGEVTAASAPRLLADQPSVSRGA